VIGVRGGEIVSHRTCVDFDEALEIGGGAPRVASRPRLQ
jgi:hypothetical protein